MDADPGEDRPHVVVGLCAAAASKSDVGAVSRAEPPPKSPLSWPGLMSAALAGLRRPRPSGHQTQKPRVARGNGSSRTMLWAWPVRGWRWGCGSLRPPASAGYCSAGEQDSGENHRDSFLVTAGIRAPIPATAAHSVGHRARPQRIAAHHQDRCGQGRGGIPGAAGCDVSSQLMPGIPPCGRIARIAAHYCKPNQARLMTPIRQLNGNNRRILNS